MSTPTTYSQLPASKLTPRSAATGLTPSASSPSRSVPSPAHFASQKAGKTPHKSVPSATQTPLTGAHGTHTPTPPGALPGSSPATGLEGLLGRARAGTLGAKSAVGSPAGGHTPAALGGLGLTLTPGQGINVPNQVNGDPILEGLGLTTRDPAATTVSRTREIVKILGERWGWVSQENLERSLKRIGGLDCMWEDPVGGKEKLGERKRTFTMAGNEMIVEIEWLGERVIKVVLTFPEGDNMVADEVGGEILKRDLTGGTNPTGSYVSLKPFVENLSRLARIDSLGKNKVSCFEALEGIGDALRKLWTMEVLKQKTENPKLETAQIELKVLCEMSGKPATHSEDKIGLRLDYWVDRRTITAKEAGHRATRETKDSSTGSLGSRFSLLIDCESFDERTTTCAPIRISHSWLAETTTEALSDPNLPIWQAPPPTFIPGTQIGAGGDAMDLDITTGTTANTHFVARLMPPIILPAHAAFEIFEFVGVPIMEPMNPFTTIASLLLPGSATTTDPTSNDYKDSVYNFDRSVRSWSASGENQSQRQRFTLFSHPGSSARTIHEIPFSHPKQLIDILPYLRQWAFFGKMLRRSFGLEEAQTSVTSISKPSSFASSRNLASSRPSKLVASSQKPRNGYHHRYQPYEPPSDTDSDDEDDSAQDPKDSRIKSSTKTTSKPAIPIIQNRPSSQSYDANIDISFMYNTMAHRIDMEVSMNLMSGDQEDSTPPIEACTIMFRIHPNAKIEVEQEGLAGGMDDGGPAMGTKWTASQLAVKFEKLLTISEDLGVCVAWLISERK